MANTTEPPLLPEQRAIVEHIKGSVLVLAPVGTGKTRILAERVLNAIAGGIPAERILCVTFTNRAAQEMRDRMVRYDAEAARKVTVKTFHALCCTMLRAESRRIGLPSDFVIYDEYDSMELVRSIWRLDGDNDDQVNRNAFNVLNDIGACKTGAPLDVLRLDAIPREVFARHLEPFTTNALRYQASLQQRHALDFADLVYYVRAMLYTTDDIAQRWRERFDLLQIDEVQDTHMDEYEVVRVLAERSGNLAMIGDVDQTIYEWRGSDPDAVLGRFAREFSPRDYKLKFNHRATKMLINASSTFASHFTNRRAPCEPSPDCAPGESVLLHRAPNEQAEGQWIAAQIKKLAAQNGSGFLYSRVAVLARTHNRNSIISDALEQQGVPAVTVEQFEFFRRQEIRDAIAYLRLIINPFDSSSARRVVERPTRRIGQQTVDAIVSQGEACGLRLADFLSARTFQGEPYQRLLNVYASDRIVVFDTETTGIELDAEIIELGAVLLVKGKVAAEFHEYIRPSGQVGASQAVHGISDAFLALNGRSAREVLSRFLAFISGAMVVGHNVDFDIRLLRANVHQAGLTLSQLDWYDTLDLAQRFVDTDDRRLVALASHFHLTPRKAHGALDDSRTTVELLGKLIPLVQAKSLTRAQLVNQHGRNFREVATQFSEWHAALQTTRPPDLLNRILQESGLIEYYRRDAESSRRMRHLAQLSNLFAERDEGRKHPDTALREITEYAALSKNVDHLSRSDNRVPIITIHQSKGLEFDTVFIAGLSEGEFPDFRSTQGRKLEEERRLFYVAMTRARVRLAISWHLFHRGRSCSESVFINQIGTQYARRDT